MASRFETDFSAGWSLLKAQHGESVTITPSGGSPSSVTAIFERGAVLEGLSDEDLGRAIGVLSVASADVPSWTPTEGDGVAIGSVTYVVALGPVPDTGPIKRVQLVATATS